MPNHSPRIIRLPEVCLKTGRSKSTIWATIDPKNHRYDPIFPKPFKLSDKGRAVGWLESEIGAYIEQRAAVRVGS